MPDTAPTQAMATLGAVIGTASVVRADGSAIQPARPGTPIGPGDRVATVGSSSALLVLPGLGEVELGGDTPSAARRPASAPARAATAIATATPTSATTAGPTATATTTPTVAPSVPPTATPTQGPTVRAPIANVVYLPDPVRIPPGGTVTWVSLDPTGHTATAEDLSWSSPLLDPGESYSHTVFQPGTYRYFREPHPRMRGEVVVE